jgi:putative ABC transport system permease protein
VGQIGVMKAIGARSRQVFAGYTILVLSYGVLAMLIALPIGALSAYGLQNLFINLLNMDNPGLQLDPMAGMVQAAVCLLVPLAAAVFPLSAGIRLTVREAISTYGLTGSAGLVDKLAAGLRRIPYSLVMIIGSAFRNRRRVLFIEITLVLAGVIFMMVRGVSDSIQYTFDDKLLRTHGYQASLNFDQVQRDQQLAGTALADPRVQVAEVWLVQPGKARPASQKDSQVTDARLQIFGLPADTEMYRADLRMGRWLLSGDQQAVVITQRLADSKGWSVGDQIILSQGDERVDPYRVVGIVFDPLLSSGAFVPLRTLQQQTGLNGQGNSIWMQTGPKDDGSLRQIVTDLTKVYERKGLKISASPIFRENTITQIVDQFGGGFDIIIQLLGIMALIIAVVGGVGLSGVISLNVLERRREIGVMRSIGASDWRVIGLFVGEGLLLGWISWLVALPLSIPAAKFMATTGLAIALNQPLVYHFTPSGALTWLVIVSLMAIIASALPARGASKISVRESLAYQ